MMDAKKANTLTYQAKERLLQESFERIESRIIESINSGSFEVVINSLDIPRLNEIKEVLISKGFVVKQTNGVFWTIKWDDISIDKIDMINEPKPAKAFDFYF